MTNRANASHNQDDENQNEKGDAQEPEVVPPDYPSAEQKAQDRGRWVREAIVKGGVSGMVRAALDAALEKGADLLP